MKMAAILGSNGGGGGLAAANRPPLPSRMLIVAIVLLSGLVSRAIATIGCSEVRHSYKMKGFDEWEVPFKAISGEHLQICPQGFTCCTKEMEAKFSKKSISDYKKFSGETMDVLQNTFRSRTQKFDRFFTELLEKAKRDLHDMFVRTYGLLYQRNSFVFTNLFHDLQSYYKGEDQNLSDVLDQFFTVLMQKMFELLNAQYQFDQTYLNCVTEFMDKLKPFGDVPQVLSHQVKRAFIAARTFVQGLAVGRGVIEEITKVQPTASCKKALMKMIYCPHCRGLPRALPCQNFCLNVMKGCLSYHYNLNTEWNNYVDALMSLAERLEGPFNIEAVVDPINVKISDAIMNFQENSGEVSSKVFAGCGQPRLSGRRKRDTHEEYPFGDWNYNNNKNYVRPTTAAGTSLDRLVRDIKGKVKMAKDFWANISYAVCDDPKIASKEKDDACWNGLGKAKYMPGVSKDGLDNQVSNPEVEVDIMKKNSIIEQQILQLQLITGKLQSAYNGQEVDWIDTADSDGSSGSGQSSGSGSGDGQDVNSGIGFNDYTLPPVQPPGNKGVRTHTGLSIDDNKNAAPGGSITTTITTILLPFLLVLIQHLR
ncbi:glypican-6-like [Tubulanus polymorphus]|uniref:glypican-6-like n=1 Tax=Tubulanus polymorphus TaxID=672921 RepID=UPI003DA6B525